MHTPSPSLHQPFLNPDESGDVASTLGSDSGLPSASDDPQPLSDPFIPHRARRGPGFESSHTGSRFSLWDWPPLGQVKFSEVASRVHRLQVYNPVIELAGVFIKGFQKMGAFGIGAIGVEFFGAVITDKEAQSTTLVAMGATAAGLTALETIQELYHIFSKNMEPTQFDRFMFYLDLLSHETLRTLVEELLVAGAVASINEETEIVSIALLSVLGILNIAFDCMVKEKLFGHVPDRIKSQTNWFVSKIGPWLMAVNHIITGAALGALIPIVLDKFDVLSPEEASPWVLYGLAIGAGAMTAVEFAAFVARGCGEGALKLVREIDYISGGASRGAGAMLFVATICGLISAPVSLPAALTVGAAAAFVDWTITRWRDRKREIGIQNAEKEMHLMVSPSFRLGR